MSEYVVMMDNSAGPKVAVMRNAVPEISAFRLEDHLDVPTDLVADVIDIEPAPSEAGSTELLPVGNDHQASEPIEETTELGASSFFEFMVGEPALDRERANHDGGVAQDEANWELPVSFYHLYVLNDGDERIMRLKNDRSSKHKRKQDQTPYE